MFRRVVCVAVLALVVTAGLRPPLAAAADSIAVELKDFKVKGTANADLVKYEEGESKLAFYTNGALEGEVDIPADGEYTISVEASCDEALNEKAKFKLTVGDVVVAKEHALTETGSKKYEFTAKLKKGKAKLGIEFLNDVYKENEHDRNLFVHSVKLEPKKK